MMSTSKKNCAMLWTLHVTTRKCHGVLSCYKNIYSSTGTVADIWSYNILWLVFIPLLAEVVMILSASRYLTTDSRYA